jgi:iron complex outermembrane receptor protein
MSTNRGKAVRTVLLLGGAAMALPFAAAPAFAQSGASEDEGFGTIIVTAQRRSERLEEVPMSVQVVTQESLASTGVNTLRDLQNVTSGFQLNNSGNTPQPAIRGITTTNAGAYENNVAVFVDGLYQSVPQALNMDLPNVQSVQILKGPQGTLYGRNATGGAILIDTIDPGADWEGMLEATYARFNDYRGRVAVSGPLGDKVGISIAGTLRHTDGYFKKASRTTPGAFDGNFLGLRQESIRAKLKFDLTEDLSVTLGGSYMHASDPRGVLFTPIENVPNSYTVPGRNTRPTGLGEVAGDTFDVDYHQYEASLKIEWNTGIGKLRSITGYTDAYSKTSFDFNGNYVPDLYSTSKPEDRTIQQAIDLSIDSIDKVDIVVGGTYYHIRTHIPDSAPNTVWLGPASLPPFTYPDPATTLVPLNTYGRNSQNTFFRSKEAWALFADLTFQATDALSINLGGRYSEEVQRVSGWRLAFNPITNVPALCNYSRHGETVAGFTCVNGPSGRQSNYSKFTPRASIRYEISPGTNIYASYSKGFRSGEWNSAIPNENPINWVDAKQESVDAYEIGLKSYGSRFRFEVAGFYYDYRDLQVSNTQSVNGVPLVILANAPKARVYGADASIDYKANDNLTLRAGATWLDAKYGDGFFISGTGVNPAGVGFNVNSDPLKVFPNVTVTQNLSGLQMSRAPDFTGFVGFDYNIPNGEGGLRFSANLKYTTSYVVTNPSIWGGDRTYNARIGDADPSNNGPPVNTEVFTGTAFAGSARASEQRARQGAYALVNASVTWTHSSGSYYVRVWGNNLGDVKYRTHYNPLSAGTYSPIGEPLSFGGTIGYKF